VFDPAAIERKATGWEVGSRTNQGWSWSELDRIDSEAGGAPQAQRDALKLLAENGWTVKRVRGSHRQLKHPSRPGTVTVAGKLSVEIPVGTWQNILRQAGLGDRGEE
jgi:predicted RNA binding protein YcfA (HicA-like mRNA interferase family)